MTFRGMTYVHYLSDGPGKVVDGFRDRVLRNERRARLQKQEETRFREQNWSNRFALEQSLKAVLSWRIFSSATIFSEI